MIISHEHQFCFFAIPRTGSKAISKALVEANLGVPLKPMHISYAEFMANRSTAELNYFTFCTVRNPLDSIVSAYFKKKNNHNGRFSRGTFKSGRPIAEENLKEYRFIKENNADFATYFEHFYKAPYTRPRHEDTLRQVDCVLRYEHLADDFARVLASLSLPDISLPLHNVTKGKDADFHRYYSEQIRPRAKMVFGKLMAEWGYAFPENW